GPARRGRLMRVAFVGGTRFVGPAALPHLLAAGHEVAIAHSGAHEPGGLPRVEHLHGTRDELLGEGGLVERWRPGALVDTFPGGATAGKAEQLAACAQRAGADHVVAISSMDVYQYLLDAGIGFGNPGTPVPRAPLPVREDDPLRAVPYPGAQEVEGGGVHDNVAMEAALAGAFGGRVTALRPGAIYGPHPDSRERLLVEMVRDRVATVPLPGGGHQIFHRVAVERVGRAIAAALERAPEGFWACNVGDPGDWTYGGLVGEVGRLLGWEFSFEPVGLEDTDHPWKVLHPVLCDTRRLEDVLGVVAPDPADALAECVSWLWENPQPGRFAPDLRPAEKAQPGDRPPG
ncbi:MAG: NAD-dependent epimerase/dehydratase, partial [Solirubrobacterales bacterium]|nr:NAD-dependent epimerase/dehydratase [Solirubrobacterales bacterium]